MTSNTRESENFGGEPVELFEFTAAEDVYRYTSSKNEATDSNGQVYKPENIRRSSIGKSDNLTKSELIIDIVSTSAIAELFKVNSPDVDIFVKVKRKHRDIEEDVILWQGYVSGCTFNDHKAVLNCLPIAAFLAKNTMTMTYQKKCNHRIFTSGCNLNFDDFSKNVTINNISGNGLILRINDLDEDENFYLDGLAKIGNSFRHITSHSKSAKEIHLFVPFENLKAGDVIQIARGCSLSLSRCKDIGNSDNFSGHPWIPIKNIFESGLK